MAEVNTVFLDACSRRPVPYTPIWLMRQAGRYLPEYRAIRQSNRMLELCQNPELVTEVTLQPLRRFPLDAAILFSDITVPFLGMGVRFDLAPGTGPVLEKPLRTADELEAVREFRTDEALPFIRRSIELLKRELAVPLIGFAGAPFTLATYLIEGRPSRDFRNVRKMIYSEPALWSSLMEKLVRGCVEYLRTQVEAGADAIQVFDSWVGVLPSEAYREAVFPHMVRLFGELRALNVPIIHFGVGTAHLLPQFRESGGDVIGLDWTVDVRSVRDGVLKDKAVQGNLDPSLLFGPFERIAESAARILSAASIAPGHVFNLGHGILPETPIDSVARLVDFVHSWRARD